MQTEIEDISPYGAKATNVQERKNNLGSLLNPVMLVFIGKLPLSTIK